MYVDNLIAPETVITIPPATIDEFRHHGKVGPMLAQDLDESANTMRALETLGIFFDEVVNVLPAEGISMFADGFKGLLGAIEQAMTGFE